MQLILEPIEVEGPLDMRVAMKGAIVRLDVDEVRKIVREYVEFKLGVALVHDVRFWVEASYDGDPNTDLRADLRVAP